MLRKQRADRRTGVDHDVGDRRNRLGSSTWASSTVTFTAKLNGTTLQGRRRGQGERHEKGKRHEQHDVGEKLKTVEVVLGSMLVSSLTYRAAAKTTPVTLDAS